MNEIRKQWLPRVLIGGCVGVALHILLGYLLGCFTLLGTPHFTGFLFPYCNFPYEYESLGILLSFALWALFGAEVGIATLPFADSGRELVVRSLIHYAVTAVTVVVWAELNLDGKFWETFLWAMLPLTLVYVLVWLGRLAAWWSELDAIREKLGLAPVTSPLRWRESLPSLGFALLLCLVVPLALHFFDAPDVPVLTAALWPYLLLPVGGFMGGLSLGKRHGLCPLYPTVCVLLTFTATLLLNNSSPWINGGIALAAALAGNLTGAARYRHKQQKEELFHA